MEINQILAYAALATGIVYAVVLLKKALKKDSIQGDIRKINMQGIEASASDSDGMANANARSSEAHDYSIQNCDIQASRMQGKKLFPQMAIGEGLVFFFAAMGFSDFLLNIPLMSRLHWTTDDRIPETLLAATIVPGSVIAFCYLLNADNIGIELLLPVTLAAGLGCFTGSHFLLKADAKKLRLILFYALLFSMAAFILKFAVSGVQPSDAVTLPVVKIITSVMVVFLLGFINAFGVPMKAAATALFSFLGLSPVVTLTLMLTIGMVSPAAGCVKVIKSEKYEKKVSLAAVIFGSIGAVLGCKLAITMNQLALTLIMLLFILISLIDTGMKIKKDRIQ